MSFSLPMDHYNYSIYVLTKDEYTIEVLTLYAMFLHLQILEGC